MLKSRLPLRYIVEVILGTDRNFLPFRRSSFLGETESLKISA